MIRENAPFFDGVPENVRSEITKVEKSLSTLLEDMYTCPVCGDEMYTTAYPTVTCPVCGHEQNGTNTVVKISPWRD